MTRVRFAGAPTTLPAMRIPCLIALLALPACGVYGKEIVLYDSRRPAPAAKAPAAADTPAAKPAPIDFSRVQELESVRDEIARLILAGFDTDGALVRKRAELEAELNSLRDTLGEDRLTAWRSQRAKELAAYAPRR